MTELAAYSSEAIRKLVELKRLKDQRSEIDARIDLIQKDLAVFHAAVSCD